MRIYVNYKDEYVSGGETVAGQEGEPWPSHEDTIYHFEPTNATLSNVSSYHEDLEVSLTEPLPNALWIVYVRYSTGNTFGRSLGHGSIEGAFVTHDEAKARATEIEKGGPSIKGYTPWDGYFERLESVEITAVPLLR